jgi:hypothetical protein
MHGRFFLLLLIRARSVIAFVPHLPPLYSPQCFSDSNHLHRQISVLGASLKPAAIPLMDSGKALARTGELVIDMTAALDLYGGALSGAGAQIRNAGDSVAQAAASCRFKTGAELVSDELREGATCLLEAVLKLKRAVEEARDANNMELATNIGACTTN